MCFGTMDPNNADVARQQHGRQRQVISDEIRARLVHHVLIHGRTMKEAGQPVHGCIHCPYFQEGERVICVVTDICYAVVHID